MAGKFVDVQPYYIQGSQFKIPVKLVLTHQIDKNYSAGPPMFRRV